MALDFIHQFLTGQSGRTVLALHGTGGDERDLIPLIKALDPTASILSPRGRVDEYGANRFFRRLAEGVFDEDSIRTETNALADFVQAAAAEYGFDATNICAIGFSNGANTAAALLLLRPELLSSAVMIRAMVPLVPDPQPDLHGKRALLLTGDADPMMPIESTRQLAQMLTECRAAVDHHILPAGHQLTREDIGIASQWLAS